jgi:hypothetical protein
VTAKAHIGFFPKGKNYFPNLTFFQHQQTEIAILDTRILDLPKSTEACLLVYSETIVSELNHSES